MTARMPGFEPRRTGPSRSHAHPSPGRAPGRRGRGGGGSRTPGILAIAIVGMLALPLGGLALLGGGSGAASPSPSATATNAAVGPSASLDPGSASPTSPVPSAPPASAPPTATPEPALVDEAILPVVHFRSALAKTGWDDVRAIEASGDGRFAALELVRADADAILATLGLDRAKLGKRLVLADDAASLAADLAKHRDRLAFVRADELDPSVRAIAWGGRILTGVGRVESLADWPLIARVADRPDDASYDPATAWTLVAGGDILLDRGVALAIQGSGRGADFPFDGGRAEITSRYCCSSFGWELPRTKRTGDGGAVRALVKGADLAIANFENPAPDRFRFHPRGTVFSANPAYIRGLRNAGLDWVSLANNHIGDAGRAGILQTLENLDEHGIAYAGAGGDRDAARRPALLQAGDVTVAFLGYDTIASYYTADEDTPGTMRMSAAALRHDVKAARAAGADVVIVMPHWGTEYKATPSASQRKLGQAAIDAGADMVIGNHAHWAAAMEVYKGKPIWYALGNFVFDQTWSEPTMEGLLLELTFSGTELVQARMHPHVILDRAQPNLLDPAGDGQVVLRQVFRASEGLLEW